MLREALYHPVDLNVFLLSQVLSCLLWPRASGASGAEISHTTGRQAEPPHFALRQQGCVQPQGYFSAVESE